MEDQFMIVWEVNKEWTRFDCMPDLLHGLFISCCLLPIASLPISTKSITDKTKILIVCLKMLKILNFF